MSSAAGLVALTAPAAEKGPEQVEVRGTLRTGVVAVGGETTGTVIETKGGPYELDLGGDKALRQKADQLNGKAVVVTGTLGVRPGVEVKERKVITVASLKEARDKDGEDKPLKADVVIEQGDKGGTAKVGQTVEIRIKSPMVAPRYRVRDVRAVVTGDALDKKAAVRHTVPTRDGKPVVGGGFESVYLKAREKGQATVQVEYPKGEDKHTHEYQIEVK
jgi:hypothetical protein